MNLYISMMRTVVPIVVGVVMSLAAHIGWDIDSAEVAIVVTGAFMAAYYTIFRFLEGQAARIGLVWLRQLAGVMLGWARPPEYRKETELHPLPPVKK